MTVYANIKRPVFKGFNTIWSLLTEAPEESKFLCYNTHEVLLWKLE